MSHFVASDLGLHCLQMSFSIGCEALTLLHSERAKLYTIAVKLVFTITIFMNMNEILIRFI